MNYWFNEDKSIKIYNEDCLTVLDKLIDNNIQVDCIVCDPPYKCISGGKPKYSYQPSGILSKNDGKLFDYNNLDEKEWFSRIYNILKDGGHCYIMTNVLNLENYLSLSKKVGFKLHNLLVWKKNNCTPNRGYMKNAEYILFLYKGKAKRINNVGSKTIHEFDNIIGNKTHPAEKPIELMKFYIENSTNIGDTVLDFACGTGSTLLACQQTKRKCIGIELDKNYFDVSIKRIKGEL